MRLYPQVPFNLRCAVEETTLPRGGGPAGLDPILVRAGDTICFSTYTMHRRKDIWGLDADEFIPARWEGDLPGAELAYLPFNTGPRACIGRKFC